MLSDRGLLWSLWSAVIISQHGAIAFLGKGTAVHHKIAGDGEYLIAPMIGWNKGRRL